MKHTVTVSCKLASHKTTTTLRSLYLGEHNLRCRTAWCVSAGQDHCLRVVSTDSRQSVFAEFYEDRQTKISSRIISPESSYDDLDGPRGVGILPKERSQLRGLIPSCSKRSHEEFDRPCIIRSPWRSQKPTPQRHFVVPPRPIIWKNTCQKHNSITTQNNYINISPPRCSAIFIVGIQYSPFGGGG